MNMKKILITLLFIITAFCANAQRVADVKIIFPSDYDSLQDARMTQMQLHLERFHVVHSTGSALWFLGLGLVAVGIEAQKINTVYVGAGLNFLGTMFMIGSHKNVKRAAFVGRTDYNLQ